MGLSFRKLILLFLFPHFLKCWNVPLRFAPEAAGGQNHASNSRKRMQQRETHPAVRLLFVTSFSDRLNSFAHSRSRPSANIFPRRRKESHNLNLFTWGCRDNIALKLDSFESLYLTLSARSMALMLWTRRGRGGGGWQADLCTSKSSRSSCANILRDPCSYFVLM